MVFVLGIERSSSTWISNILDMHPGTEVYMEPLSENTSRFAHWPVRFVKMDDLPSKARYFREEFEQLKKRKRFMFSRLFDKGLAWKIDIMLARRLWGISGRARDFFELNFHRAEVKRFPPKSQKTETVIKELRLNFNAALIPHIDRDAKVIVILRNFASNIRSIEHQIEAGNLKGLAAILKKRYGNADIHAIFDYWATSYNTLLSDLDEHNVDYLLVKQEELIRREKPTIEGLLEFLDLQPAETLYDYVSASNKSGEGKHTTNRDHEAILEKDRQAEKELRPMLEEQISGMDLHPLLKKHITKI